jgi:ABC-type sugar transport system ATPase subunit
MNAALPGPTHRPADVPPSADARPVLEVRGVSKSFPGVRALDRVDLTLRRGRLNALMGENGAGKSTLVKILSGVFPQDEGEVLLDGQPVAFRSTLEAREAGVAIIFQELTGLTNLSVAENLFLGREPLTRWGFIDFARMHRDAEQLLATMGVAISTHTLVGELSIAQQQVLEIARAVSFAAKVLILDEPTSALTWQETAALFRLIDQLKADGVALLYITHRFEELAPIADEVTVFRDGKYVAEKPFCDLDQPQLVRMMIGRDPLATKSAVPSGPRSPVLKVEHLTRRGLTPTARPLVHDCSFAVGAGEIVGLFGLMGAGRTELLEALFGLHPEAVSGQVWLDGTRLALLSAEEAVRAGLALAPEDRKSGGLVLGMSIAENITLASLEQVSRNGILSTRREASTANRFMDRFQIRASSTRQEAGQLSGGNQQKVVLAKWLATRPQVLMLDEPTRGIDIGAKQEVYGLLGELAGEGMGLLVVSSEAPELLLLCDRILVLCEGRLQGEFLRHEADEHKLLAAALPAAPGAGSP